MPHTEVDKQNPKSYAEMDRIRMEFDLMMNTPCPNPRNNGMTPLEITRALLRTKTKKLNASLTL